MAVLKRSFPAVARVALGLIFTLFGLNGFLHFLPTPAMPEAAGQFMGALAASGYMFPLIKGTELAAGLLLLAGRYVPLALVLLAPIVVNIVAFHAALAPEGIGMSLFVLAAELYLAWHHRAAFRGVLAARSGEPEKARTAITEPAVGRA